MNRLAHPLLAARAWGRRAARRRHSLLDGAALALLALLLLLVLLAPTAANAAARAAAVAASSAAPGLSACGRTVSALRPPGRAERSPHRQSPDQPKGAHHEIAL